MRVTMQRVLSVISVVEPDYRKAAELGPDALPHLRELVIQGNPRVAPKAAYLAGLIGGNESAEVLGIAARSADVTLRLAAANAARHLREEAASSVLLKLLGDKDRGVRKAALNSIPPDASGELRVRVEQMSKLEVDRGIRELADRLRQTMH